MKRGTFAALFDEKAEMVDGVLERVGCDDEDLVDVSVY